MFHLLKALAAHHELTVVCRVMNDEQLAGLAELRQFCAGVHGVMVPSPRSTLGRLRWLLPFVFSRYPLSLCTVYFKSIRDVLRRMAREQRFDIVQVEHSSLTIYLDHVQFSGDPATVLTMHNIDHLRNQRIIDNTPFGAVKLYHLLNQARFKQYELEAVSRYGTVVAMSGLDRQALLQDLPVAPVVVIPNGVDCRQMAFAPVHQPEPSLVFVASMDSEANHDGAMFFLDEVMPLIQRSHPSVVVAMVGRGPRAALAARNGQHGVTVTGQVADVLPYYRSAAMSVVPLRSGGGTRLKILEAMALGTPVVSTTVGAEGLDVIDGVHLLLADSPQAMADAVGRLIEDPPLAASLAVRARRLVEQRYDWPLIGVQHDQVYRDTARNARH